MRAEAGKLQLLQWYNMTCNDCGGRTSGRCLNATSCGLPMSNCTCESAGADDGTEARRRLEALPLNPDGSCSYANMS